MAEPSEKTVAGLSVSDDAIPAASPVQHAAHIRDLVRIADQDRYWSALFAPEPARQSLLALYALSIELSRIPDRVSEPQLGEIRLQWWRDALHQAMETGQAEHPVVAALAEAARRYALPLHELEAMIEAHKFDLSGEPMRDEAALFAYIDATSGARLRLAATVMGADPDEGLVNAAARAGGLTALMRSLPHDASQGRIFLPADLLAGHGLHPNAILSGTDNPDLRAALRDLREQAGKALEEVRPRFARLPRSARIAFLPLAPLPAYLRVLASPELNPIRQVVQLNPLRRYALIWRAYLTGLI
jgi:phytoene synthase